MGYALGLLSPEQLSPTISQESLKEHSTVRHSGRFAAPHRNDYSMEVEM